MARQVVPGPNKTPSEIFMKNQILSIWAFTFLFASTAYGIGSVQDAKIIKVRVDNNGPAMIIFDKQISGTPPACPTYTNGFGIDTTNPGGKSVLSMALAAKATGSSVDAYGTGACGVYGGYVIESWHFGSIN